jgi:hypothetical protein
MARTEQLGEGEVRTCGFCGVMVAADYEDTHYVIVGEAEDTWHVSCAESVGINVEYDEDEPDPDFDHDPNYDGAEDDDEHV